MWLCATNHCLLAGVLDMHGCESSQCTEHHGLDHGDDCRGACDTLEKPLLSKSARDEALTQPPQILSDAPFLGWPALAGLTEVSNDDEGVRLIPEPFDFRAGTWHFRRRAAAWPGAPCPV